MNNATGPHKTKHVFSPTMGHLKHLFFGLAQPKILSCMVHNITFTTNMREEGEELRTGW
jgi:hypothetical protein